MYQYLLFYNLPINLVPISVTEGSGASAAPTMSDKPAKRGRKKTTPTPAIPMPKKRVHKNWFRFERGHRAHPRMKLGDMLLVTSELSDLLASGMTLGSALHALAQRSTGKPLIRNRFSGARAPARLPVRVRTQTG